MTSLTGGARLVGLASLLGLLVSSLTAHAAPIEYPGVFEDYADGGAIAYTDVAEDSATDDPPLYGPPEVEINRLDFEPSGFGANGSNGGADITDGQLNFMFDALPGAGVTSFSITESGSDTLAGNGTADTLVGYGALVEVTILEVDGAPVSPIEVPAVNMSGTLNLVDDADIGGMWSLGILVELGPSLVNTPFNEGVTLAEVVIDNTLIAIGEPGTIAFIDKKDFFIDPDGDLTPDEIPEPAAAVLALVACGVAQVRRR